MGRGDGLRHSKGTDGWGSGVCDTGVCGRNG